MKNIIRKNKNRILKTIMSLSFSFMFIFSSLMTYSISYADTTTIPDKGNFKEYIRDMYQLDDNSAQIDEQLKSAINDYKNRYIMYVDIDYVLGDVNDSNKSNVYYLEDYGSYYLPQAYEPTAAPLGGMVPPQTKTADIDEIWNFLIGKGFTEIAAAGIMGNMKSESGFIPNNLENSANKKWNITDEAYTKQVDDGSYSRNNFAKDGGGYGIVQFTYAKWKEMLYDNAKAAGVSVSHLPTQLNTLWTQIQGMQSKMNACTTLRDAAVMFQTEYEKPKRISETTKQERTNNAQAVYNAYARGGNAGAGGETVYFQGAVPEGFSKTLYQGDAKYGSSTLKESGAAPTALAMVATTLSTYITPSEVAKHSGKYYIKGKGSNIDILTDVEDYGLKVTRIGKDTNKLYEALQEGKVVIAVTGNKEAGAVEGLFNRTSEANFIVVFGYDNNGYLDVADPDGANYYNIKGKNITLKYLKGEAIGGFYVYEPLRK